MGGTSFSKVLGAIPETIGAVTSGVGSLIQGGLNGLTSGGPMGALTGALQGGLSGLSKATTTMSNYFNPQNEGPTMGNLLQKAKGGMVGVLNQAAGSGLLENGGNVIQGTLRGIAGGSNWRQAFAQAGGHQFGRAMSDAGIQAVANRMTSMTGLPVRTLGALHPTFRNALSQVGQSSTHYNSMSDAFFGHLHRSMGQGLGDASPEAAPSAVGGQADATGDEDLGLDANPTSADASAAAADQMGDAGDMGGDMMGAGGEEIGSALSGGAEAAGGMAEAAGGIGELLPLLAL